jgi:hypothetical protein
MCSAGDAGSPGRGSGTGSCSSTPPWTAPAANKRGPEDDRTAAQRFHDALQEGCAPQPRVCRLGLSGTRRQVRGGGGEC